MSKFLIALDNSTKEQNEKFVDFINEKGYGWWHWIDNFWIIDTSSKLTAVELRNELGELYPNINKLVIELKNNNFTWAGYGPSNENNNMFDWLKRNF